MIHPTAMALAITFLLGSTSTGQADIQKDVPKPARQKQLTHLLIQDCGSCHGLTLKGGLGPALLPSDIDWQTTEQLTATIYYGRPGTAMPGWHEILTEPETRWLAQQLLKGVSQ